MKKQDDKFTSNAKHLVKLLPAAAVAAAVVVSGVQGNADANKNVETQSSESMSEANIGELVSTAYSADTDMNSNTASSSDADSKSTKSSKSKKTKKTKKAAAKATAKALPDESAKTSATGQGSTTTPTTSVPAGGYKDGTYQGSATGFGGTITVSVTVSGGKIASIDIVSAPGETASYFASAKGVINKIISGQNPNVDVVSGATYSSNGIIGAVQNALSKAANSKSTTPTPTPTAAPKKYNTNSNSSSSNVKYKDGTYSAEAEGYDGLVKVTVTIKNGKIAKITNTNTDTKQFFNNAWSTISSSILSGQNIDKIDTVSGATFSSEGILNAAKAALKKAAVTVLPTAKPTAAPTATPTVSATLTPTPVQTLTPTPAEDSTVTPLPDSGEDADTVKFKDGTYTGEGKGYAYYEYGEDDYVTVTVTIKDNKITKSISSMGADTRSYFNKAWLGTTRGNKYYTGIKAQVEASMSTDGIDTVSGATYSSNGIIEAYRNALAKAMVTPSVTPTTAPTATPTVTPTPTLTLTPTPEPTATLAISPAAESDDDTAAASNSEQSGETGEDNENKTEASNAAEKTESEVSDDQSEQAESEE